MALVYLAFLPRCIREHVSPAIRSRIRNPQPRRQNRPHGYALFDWHRLIESYFKASGNEAAHAGRRAVGNSRDRIATRNQIRTYRDLAPRFDFADRHCAQPTHYYALAAIDEESSSTSSM